MTRVLTTTRRRLLLGTASLPLWAALAACGESESKPSFTGTDITGANYGRDFALSDPDGKRRTLADFKGKVVMIFFGFTQCPDICPTALTRAAEVKQQLGAAGDDLQVIFVTVDPERDTPEVMRAYTAAFDPSFLGLRGDLAQTEATAKEFKVFYEKVPTRTSYTMDHSAFTYLIDRKGRMRVVMRYAQSASEFTADVRALLAAG
ncbi:SCO family protein [Variovorax sp.]|jgi:protein SCO1/2|uniref:SCO family protein n=1 Tax=Variovorax sp. TaxID=1871043 RepID=UPI0037DA6781